MRKLLAILLFATTAFAIEPKQQASSLDAKTLAFPQLSPNFDAARIDAYLTDPVWKAWNAAHGGNWTAQFDTLTGHPRRVYGGAIPWVASGASAADLERMARDFITANSSVLGVANAQLRFVPEAANATRDGNVRYAAFDYTIDGVPVEHGRLIFAVNHGNMIYWHSANIAGVPAATTPSISATQALASLLAYAGVSESQVTVVRAPTLKLLPHNRGLGQLLGYQLVYEAAFRTSASHATWAAYVDALTGTVLAFADTNDYATACPARTSTTGRVTGGVRPAQATDAEVVRSFSFAALDGHGQSSANGTFAYDGGTVSTGLNGSFFDTNCADCVKSESDPQSGFQPFASSNNGRINLGTGGHDVVLGAGQPTTSYGNGTSTPADRTAFFHTNVARQIALKWLAFPWLQSKVTVNVNINDVCNAFWDGNALNFFKSGELTTSSGALLKCKNTGEIRDVMQHEWGHGLDGNDGEEPGYALGLGDMATGEASADHIALFVDHDSCIGQSFYNRVSGPFVTNPDTGATADCDGVRNLDELRAKHGTMTATNVTQVCGGPPVSTGSPTVIVYVGPLLNEGHCEGEIWGQTDWHLANDFLSGRKYGTSDALPASADGSPNPALDKDAAWTLLEHLYFESRPLVASYAPSRYQAMGASAYDGYLVVDDEGDGLANGTPHAAYINDAYTHHQIEEWGTPGGVPAGIDAKNCDAPATPQYTLTQSIDGATGTPAVTLAWTPVAGASSYSILRNERRNDVFLEVGRVSGTSTFTDAGLDNGVTYNYRLQANGNTTCFATSAGGVKTIAIAQPDATLGGVTIADSAGGNGDHKLDAGEKANLYLGITNSGIAGLTNVTATLTSLTPGVSVTKAGPRSYGSIGAGATAGPSQAFAVAIDPNGALCGTDAFLVLNVSSDQGCFAVPVTVSIGSASSSCFVFKSAYAQPQSVTITSDKLGLCGDGDNVPDPNETVQVTVTVNNTGEKSASGVAVKLVSNKSYLAIPVDTVSLGSLAALGAETKTATFSVKVAPTAPFNDTATLTAVVSFSGGATTASKSLTTAVNRDRVKATKTYDFDSSDQGWTDATGMWKRELALTTGDLTTVFHSTYNSDSCQSLVSPPVEATATSALAFDLAYVSENSDAPYDGVTVEVSADDGKTWSTLDVAQGYPALSAGTTCISEGLPFFSGVSPLMQHYDADLSAFAGKTVRIRFRFGSDQLVDAAPAGAWVDNIITRDIVISVPSAPCQ